MKKTLFLLLYLLGFSIDTILFSVLFDGRSISIAKETPTIPIPQTSPAFVPFKGIQPSFILSGFPNWGNRTSKPRFTLIQETYTYNTYVDKEIVPLGGNTYGFVIRVIPLFPQKGPGGIEIVDFYAETNCSQDFNVNLIGATTDSTEGPNRWKECESYTCGEVTYSQSLSTLASAYHSVCNK